MAQKRSSMFDSLASSVRRAQLVVLPEVSHFPWLEGGEAFTNTLRNRPRLATHRVSLFNYPEWADHHVSKLCMVAPGSAWASKITFLVGRVQT
jgi:hypothetical protein